MDLAESVAEGGGDVTEGRLRRLSLHRGSSLAIVLLAAPLAARADIGLRLGAEAGVVHTEWDYLGGNKGNSVITDHWPLAANLMLSYWLPSGVLSLDGEVSESFTLSPARYTATTLRGGVTFSPPVLPFYLRGAIPLKVDPSPRVVGLRLGAGMTGELALFKLYLELDADFPVFGSSGAPNAFSTQDISLGAGVQFKL
jgi:hypothetical protein